jgi:Zn-dependent M28 family amino/carboxypeptidase
MDSQRRWPARRLAALAGLAGMTGLAAVGALAARGAPAGTGTGGIAPGRHLHDPEATAWTEAGRRWWAHVQYLADDRLEGRLTGSAGYRKAAAYVAQHFKEYGLEPAGENGYFQPVPFEVQRVIAAESRLALVRPPQGDRPQGGVQGRAEPLAVGEDALLSSRLPQPKTLDAPLVFAGYALHLPEAGYDDLPAASLNGKVVVYINGGPGNIAGALKAHARAGQEFYRALEQAGAIGAIGIPNPKSMDIPWSRMALASSQSGMWIAEEGLQDTRGPMLVAIFNPARAEKLFAGSGHSFAELLALVDAHQALPRFPLTASLRAAVVTRSEQVTSPNVVAVLPGRDPRLKNEYVVLSAHLDHLGIGEPIAGDRIYNGAMDNASGVAALLEIARSLQAAQEAAAADRPRRSILFLAVCGEEKGLLGSRYFAAHPTVPPGALVADLNMDMFLPLFPLRYLTTQGVDESTLGDDARAVGRAEGVEIVADRFPDRNLFIRSDQYNFIRKGVPALAFGFAGAPGSPEEKMQHDWLTQRYHAPSDDASQPVDLAAAARFNQLMLKLAERVADADARPAWKETSFFRRFAPAAGRR